MALVDFVIAGAHKCATTTLHDLLDCHSRIAMSRPKEPHYFARTHLQSRLHTGVWDRDGYSSIWDPAGRNSVRGESSVLYLPYAEEVTERFLSELDEPPRVIVSLRDPVARAFSAYVDVKLKNPDEHAPTFDEAVHREMERGPWRLDGEGSPTLRHLALGAYADGLETLQRRLGADRVRVILMEQIVRSPQETVAALHSFLGLDPEPLPDHVGAKNVGGREWKGVAGPMLRSRLALRTRRVLKTVTPGLHSGVGELAMRHLSRRADPMSRETRQVLIDLYRPQVARLGSLTGLDLSGWLKSAQ